MVTLIPGYMYSIVAAVIVGTIIVAACAVSMTTLRNEAVKQQLANVDEYVAAQSMMLINQASGGCENASVILDLPTAIGNQEYWVSLANDSSSAWVESGFGSVCMGSQPQMYIPAGAAASGSYVSGWGRAMLECFVENQTVTLTLTSG